MPDPTDEPPVDLPAIRPDEFRRVRGSTTLWRIYSVVDHPLPWNALRYGGPASSRWDPHPQGEPREHRGRAVHYSATSIVTALAEGFQQHRTVICAPGMRLVGYRLGRGVRMLNAKWSVVHPGRCLAVGGVRRSAAYAAVGGSDHGREPGPGRYCVPLEAGSGATCLALWLPAADALEQGVPVLDLPIDAADLRGPIADAADRIGYDLEVGRSTVWEG